MINSQTHEVETPEKQTFLKRSPEAWYWIVVAVVVIQTATLMIPLLQTQQTRQPVAASKDAPATTVELQRLFNAM